MTIFNIQQINERSEGKMISSSTRKKPIELGYSAAPYPVEHQSVNQAKSHIKYYKPISLTEMIKRREKSLEKGKKALANGKACLMPYRGTDKPRNLVRIVFYKKSSTAIDINDALSILKSSHLTWDEIQMAVFYCWSHFHRELSELFRMLDEQARLEALIITEDSNDRLLF